MLPSCKTRIESAFEDLQSAMVGYEDNDVLKATEDWQTADALLTEITGWLAEQAN